MNHVFLIGNLTRDPELTTVGSGASLCKLGLAVNERYKDSSGEWTERVNFFDIAVWGGQAESCSRYLTKGRQIAVAGRLRYESWEKDGQKRSKVTVTADRVQFLGGGDRNGQSRESDVPIDTSGLSEPSSSASGDDDIPF